MAKYNLNLNSYFSSVSVAGTGKILQWFELETLMDYDTTGSGVEIANNDVLNLETCLIERIVIDGIRLYMSSATASGTVLNNHLNFYYKNREEDNYILADKYSNGIYYYATIPQPSAPAYILCTISGIDAVLFEYQIFNDDYLVAFGEDGTLTNKRLDRSTIGQEGTATVLPIFNNASLSTDSVSAYICVDVDGLGNDISPAEYLSISNSENGTYYKLEDGSLIDNNSITKKYYWDMGVYDNTEIGTDLINTYVVLSDNVNMFSLQTLPMTDSSENWKVYTRPCCYHSIKGKMYFLGADTGTRLRLYEYNYIDNEFTFISDIKYGSINETQYKYHASISCVKDNYVYVNYDRLGMGFGRYNLDDSVNNWEQLADIPLPPEYNVGTYSDQDEVCIFSDNEEYIYAIARDHTIGTPAPANYFGRYSTISGISAGWESLDKNYTSEVDSSYSSYDWIGSMFCTYDNDRDCVYMTTCRIYGESAKYIQRYDVATNLWDATWFYLAPVISSASRHGADVAYHKDYIYISSGSDNAFYRLHVPTLQLETILTNFHSYVDTDDIGSIFIKESHLGSTSLSDIIVYFNHVSGARNKLYSYGGSENVGTYTSPIIELEDKYMSSYFVIKSETSDSTNCSTDRTVKNGTIEIKSSDIKPINADRIYWTNRSGSTTRISEYNVSSGLYNLNWATAGAGSYWTERYLAARHKTGHVVISRSYIYGTSYLSHIEMRDSSGDSTYVASYSGDHRYWFSKMVFDKYGGVWGMCSQSPRYRLVHFNERLDTICTVEADDLMSMTGTVGASGDPFMTDICEEMGGDGLWGIYYYKNALWKIDSTGLPYSANGYPIFSISQPIKLVPRSDGTCWVLYAGGASLAPMLDVYILGDEISLPYIAEDICSDYADGVWYISGSYVYHINYEGIQIHSVLVNRPTRVFGGYNRCFVWSDYYNEVYCIEELEDGTYGIKYIYSLSIGYTTGLDVAPTIFSLDYSNYLDDSKDAVKFPMSDDPVWGPSGLASWQTVSKNGYFLPKNRYHQARITLRSLLSEDTPKLNKIIMAPAIKVEELQQQQSKNIYIKTDIPNDADVEDYEVNLRTWWKLVE